MAEEARGVLVERPSELGLGEGRRRGAVGEELRVSLVPEPIDWLYIVA